MATRRPHCIVIGAGLAGLAAALKLSNKGWRVTILEGATRIGGRVLTKRFEESTSENLTCELGAEWIGDDHHRVKGLCRRFHLSLKPHRFASTFWPRQKGFPRRVLPGRWPFSRKAKRGFDRLKREFHAIKKLERDKRRLKMQALDQNDWWTTLGRNGFTTEELARRDLMDSTDFGESIRLSSSYLAGTEYFDSNSTDEMDFKIRRGNGELPRRMAARLRRKRSSTLRTGAMVRRVEQDGRRVRVFIEGRQRPFAGDFCICTVPAHRLPTITWKPKLHRKKVAASRGLQYSRIMKTAVLYAERFWEKGHPSKKYGFSVFTPRASDFCFDSTFGQRGTMGILCSYAIGDKADDLAAEPNPNNLMKWITEDVAAAVQPKRDVVLAPITVERQPWHRETAIGGAYAFYRPGQWFWVRRWLRKRHDRVYFAGEHLSEEWQGFMEGAVETGYAAAADVRKQYESEGRTRR